MALFVFVLPAYAANGLELTSQSIVGSNQSYEVGQRLTHNQIIAAPDYLKDGIFVNGEIVSGEIVNEEPDFIEIQSICVYSLYRSSLTEGFMLSESSATIASGLKSLNNHINYSVGSMTVYNRADGPSVPTYTYDDLLYNIVLQKKATIGYNHVKTVANALGDSANGIFWDLNSTNSYRIVAYMVDSLPDAYLAEGEMTISNISN